MRVWWVGMREQLRLPVLVLLVGLRAPDAARAAARQLISWLQSHGSRAMEGIDEIGASHDSAVTLQPSSARQF